MDDDRRAFRVRTLSALGGPEQAIEALLAYGDKPFPPEAAAACPAFPLEDEPQVEAWAGYLREAREQGAFAALKQHLVQLRFPIREGISQEDEYRQATRRGIVSAAADAAESLTLARPDRLELVLAPTMAGRVPVLVAGDRSDFVTLVQAFSGRNEPIAVADAMGACLVKGLNDWSRIRAHRRRWERQVGEDASDAAWTAELARLVPSKELYQDRFIILSRGPYSAVPGAAIGMDEAQWQERSLVLRREHELTHYFTYRVFGAFRNNVFDELLADFVGLARAFGHYRADWALRFLGLEAYPAWRPGGRLSIYLGDPPLPDAAFPVVQTLAVRSARNLQALAEAEPGHLRDPEALGRLTFALTCLTLEELASDQMAPRLEPWLA